MEKEPASITLAEVKKDTDKYIGQTMINDR